MTAEGHRMSTRPLSSLSLPSATLSALTRAGYETVQDLSTASLDTLAKEIRMPLHAIQAIFSASQKPMLPPMTQSAASMASTTTRFSTSSAPVDKLLSGGLQRGHILEISGPPGTPKESIAVNVVVAFVEADEGVLFIDMQNMTTPAVLKKALLKSAAKPEHYESLIYYLNLPTISDFLIFMHNLSSYLSAHPKISLLVLNSVSFPFQSAARLAPSARTALLERIKNTLTKACASRNLTVVTTSQLATKLLHADGSTANFDTVSKAIMVPQLGPAYLPSGRTYRLIIVPQARTSGVVRVMSSPTYQPGRGQVPQEPYRLERGVMV